MVTNMLYMCMYLLNYIMFIIVMVMSCNAIRGITCIIDFLSIVNNISNIILTIILVYILCTISVNSVMLINKNIAIRIKICVL